MYSWSDTAASTLDTASPSSPQWSEPTSDEPADLGAFGSVFRALSTINTSAQQPHFRTFPAPTPTSSAATNTSPSVPSLSESDGDGGPGTVWSQRPIANYLSPADSAELPSPLPASVPSTPPPPALSQDDDDDDDDDDDEDEDDEANGTERQQFDDDGDEDELPSLGLFDSTLGFIAEERARLAAERLTNGLNAALDTQGIKRKRRRRRRGRGREGDEDGSPEYDTSTGDALSAPERSQPQTPRRRKQQQQQQQPQQTSLTVTPIAPPLTNGAAPRPLPVPPSPAVQRLRSLAQKLRGMYPDDAEHLSRVLREMREPAELGGFVDVRGPPPMPADPVVHVFVDYSNILIGFISFIKRHPELYPRRGRDDKPRLSHEAMSLVFERGRPTAKRELAASKPLYQPMTTAYQLGFDVHLFQRVPHEDANSPASPSSPTKRRNGHGPQSSDSDFARARWREQGVDECLQLKMYQSVVGPDTPGTIVLATGDAAPSQYNAMGFPGTVQSALDRGWSVELYAWENGLSAGWARTFGHNERFRIRGLEEFAEYLATPYIPPSTPADDSTANVFAA